MSVLSVKSSNSSNAVEAALQSANQGTSFMSAEDIARVREESSRRIQASRTGGASTLTDGGSCKVPFKQASQLFGLVNFSNKHLRPQSQEPAFRVLGLFDCRETLEDHVRHILQLDPSLNKCNMHMLTTHAFYSVPLTQEFDMAAKQEAVNQNLLEYNRRLLAVSEEFAQHKEDLTKERQPANLEFETSTESIHEAQKRINANKARVFHDEKIEKDGVEEGKEGKEESEESEESGESEESETAPLLKADAKCVMDASVAFEYSPSRDGPASLHVNQMSRACEVRNQSYVSVMILRDYLGDDKEPAINLLAAFSTEEECLKYNKYVAAAQIEDFDLYIKCMYEWTYPNMVFSPDADNVEQLYRNEELDRIMRAHSDSKTSVERFNSYFRQEKMEIPTMEVEPDLLTRAPRTYNPPSGSGISGPTTPPTNG